MFPLAPPDAEKAVNEVMVSELFVVEMVAYTFTEVALGCDPQIATA